ncbi:MAG: tetratricopeptide repeat protein [Rubripirellula sp.]
MDTNQHESNRHHRLLYVLGGVILAVAIAITYRPALDAPFIFDDEVSLNNNESIRSLWPLIQDNGIGALNSGPDNPLSARPLVNFSFAINYFFGQLNPVGYRIVNLVIHWITAVLLWILVAKTLRLPPLQERFSAISGRTGFLSALLWSLHPINSESVIYMTQRTELMMGMFYLMTLLLCLCYWQAESTKSRLGFLLLAMTACVAGVLSKEMMASVPGVVLLYESLFVRESLRDAIRQSWKLYLALALSWIPFALMYSFGWRTPGGGFSEGVLPHHWWISQSPVVFTYLKLVFWPDPLVIHYGFPVLTAVSQAWPAVLGNAILILAAIWLWRRRSPAAFSIIAFYAVLSPTLLIPLPDEPAAERRMYIPLAALVPLLAIGAHLLVARITGLVKVKHENTSRAFAAILLASLAILFGVISLRRAALYQNHLALWQHTLVHQAHNPVAWYSTGTLLALDDKVEAAVPYFQEAARLDPTYYKAVYNLAHAYDRLGQDQEAADWYEKTLEIEPDDAATHLNLGNLLENLGHPLTAIEHYRAAIATDPKFEPARTNLGLILLSRGNATEAVIHLRSAVSIKETIEGYMNLILANSRAGQTQDTLETLEAAMDFAKRQGDQALEARLEQAHSRLQNANATQ